MSESLLKRISRRNFVRAAAIGVAAPMFVPARLLGRDAPSKKITVGFIGTGEHGTNWNLKAYLGLADAKVLMVCDVDGERMRTAKVKVDAAYGNSDCTMSKDFRDVLARKDIDAVMISTPDHWHTLISVMAARAGKDVQCEKPTLCIDEGKILIREMRKHRRVFQTSTEDRSLPVYHRMAELVRNGRIGKLQRIEVILPKQPMFKGDPTPQPVPKDLDYEMWLGPAPEAPYTKDRVHFNFRWIWDYSGGIICDWGAHLFDTAQWANNTERSGPVEVGGTGTFWNEGLFNTVKDYNV
ncbi:MAG: Gfo/Idh/MocA family protein, partial [Limisphaerales bacterium]